MLEYTIDKEGNLQSVIDFWVVDKSGKLDDKGEYVFVNEWYISPKYRGNGTIAEFAKRIIKRVPWAKYAYFERRKYNNRISIYPKRKWLKIIQKEDNYGRLKSTNNAGSTDRSTDSR